MMTDLEISEGLKHGSPEAFRALYAAHGVAIHSYLVRITGRREMAEELTQETFLTAIRKAGFYKHRHDGGLRGWIFRIASNLALDSLRREKKVALTESGEAPEAAELDSSLHQELENSQLAALVTRALEKLTATARMIFLLHEKEELSCMEISRIVGISENSVKQSLFRSRATLRKALCD